jgi:hypothetical protein
MNDYLQIKELYHWGIKGQKWGIRRYQNEDGSLTEEGLRRYAHVDPDSDEYKNKTEQEKSEIHRQGAVNYRSAAKQAEATEQVLGSAKNLTSFAAQLAETHKGSKAIRKDYSDLSDEELRNRVNRLNLERSYGDLTGDTKYVMTGREKVHEVLQSAGAVLGIAGSAVGIYIALKGYKQIGSKKKF